MAPASPSGVDDRISSEVADDESCCGIFNPARSPQPGPPSAGAKATPPEAQTDSRCRDSAVDLPRGQSGVGQDGMESAVVVAGPLNNRSRQNSTQNRCSVRLRRRRWMRGATLERWYPLGFDGERARSLSE